MATENHSCVTVACDGCQERYGDPDTSASWHFPTIETAVADAAEYRTDYGDDIEGWMISPDGAASCPECRRKQHCAEHGHTRDDVPARTTGDWTHPAYSYCEVCSTRLELPDGVGEAQAAAREAQLGDRVLALRDDGRLIEGTIAKISGGGESS